MGYPVTKLNSCECPLAGIGLFALAAVPNGDVPGYDIGIMQNMPDGTWVAVLPFLKTEVTSDQVMAAGTVADYLLSLLPLAEQRLKDITVGVKPDQSDKCACLAYDLPTLKFDESACKFLMPPLPLRHALP
jgi:hypothetical protein